MSKLNSATHCNKNTVNVWIICVTLLKVPTRYLLFSVVNNCLCKTDKVLNVREIQNISEPTDKLVVSAPNQTFLTSISFQSRFSSQHTNRKIWLFYRRELLFNYNYLLFNKRKCLFSFVEWKIYK